MAPRRTPGRDTGDMQSTCRTAANTALQDRIWSAQCPQMQLQKKSENCARLRKRQSELLEQTKEAGHDQQAMQAEADKYEAQAVELLALHFRD